jgi:hypothetical protein
LYLNNTQNFKRKKIEFGFYILFFMLVLFSSTKVVNAQWINNPSENTKLVIDASEPINISAVTDSKGGAFIFWQDNKYGLQNNEVYFMHVKSNGRISFRADGKRVSTLPGAEEEPVSTPSISGSAVVVWKDFSSSHFGNLYAQRVSSNGNYYWQPDGIGVTQTQNEIGDFSVCANKNGNIFVAYVLRPSEITGEYKLEIQKISPNGNLFFDTSPVVYESRERKSSISIIDDGEGGTFLLWLEYRNNKSILLAQRVDSLGLPMWKKPIEISANIQNVTLYTAVKMNYPAIYVAWQQIHRANKDIYHQILTNQGKFLWYAGGRNATPQNGSQVNPMAVASDSSAILSWTDESTNNKNIYIQKFNKYGRPEWGRSEIPVIKVKGEQFGQKIISDGKGGAIVAWIDMRNKSANADIYAQRINNEGRLVWDSLGLPIGSNFNSLKSYLSLLPDENGGAIAIFKDNRNGKNAIYGQKIFTSGTFISQLIGPNTEINRDSIKISWYTANERGNVKYTVERASLLDADSISWDIIGNVFSNGQSGAKHYVYVDVPNITGTLYYRIIQTDAAGDIQKSDISRINYFGSSSKVVVAQNFPNPFSDSTTISFYLPEPTEVIVEFYNSHVEKINEIDKSFPSGENKINFSAKGLKAGIYFYRFRAGNFVDVKKMIIAN